MVKVVTLFLVVLAVLAMLGRIRMPDFLRPGKRRKELRVAKCPNCGAYLLGGDKCDCRSGRR